MSPQVKPVTSVGAVTGKLIMEKDAELVESKPANRLKAFDGIEAVSDAEVATNGFGPAQALRPESVLPRRRKLFPPWLRRRWWVLVLCIVAGTGGGILARDSQVVKYSGSAELNVASGSGSHGPGPANDAIALALTDATIIPYDQSTLQRVSRETGTSIKQLANSLSATAVDGTSAILVNFKAASPATAIKDVNDVARVLIGGTPDSAIPKGSLDVVQLATSATTVGTLHSYGEALGVLFGILMGAIAILAIERADPRIDDVWDLAQVTGTTASTFPGPIPVIELERSIARASGDADSVTLAPLFDADEKQAYALRRQLTSTSDPSALTFSVSGSVTSRSAVLAQATGPTVLVVTPNARSRVVQSSVHRLQRLGRGPVWAVLAVGNPRPETPT